MDTTVNQRTLMQRINRIMKDRYVVLRPIGKGGMSHVFLIQSDDGFKLRRALKLIDKSEYAGRVDYYGEIEALKSLRNVEAVTDIIEVLQDERYLYIVQELVEGESLREIRDRGVRISNEGIRKLMFELSIAMGQLEEKGILHRDIKPDNILVTYEGKVKIIDFGISAFADESLKQDHIPTGTRAYMAPELYEGVRSNIQTDIYAFGATFYSMITLNPPEWVDKNSKQRIHHMRRELKQDASVGISYIIEKCMRYDPKKRFRSFKEISACLQRLEVYDNILQARTKARMWKRTLAGVLSIAGVACLFSGIYMTKQDHINAYQNQITNAKNAYTAGDYQSAQNKYTKAQKMDSKYPDAYVGLVQIQSDAAESKSDSVKKQEFQSVIETTERYMDSESTLKESPELQELLGNAYYEVGKGDGAEYDERKYRKAEKCLKKAIKENSNEENELTNSKESRVEFAQMLLGQIYVDEKKDSDAKAMLTELEKSSSVYKDSAVYLQGWMDESEHDYSAATSKYKQILKQSKKSELKRKAANELGIIYLKKEKDFQTAVKVLESALKDENLKNDFTLNLMLLEAYSKNEEAYNPDNIISQSQKLLRFNFPDSDLNDTLYKSQIMAYIKKNDFDSANNVWKNWPENGGNEAGRRIYKAIISGNRISEEQDYSYRNNPKLGNQFIKDYEEAEPHLNEDTDDITVAKNCGLEEAYQKMLKNKELYEKNEGDTE